MVRCVTLGRGLIFDRLPHPFEKVANRVRLLEERKSPLLYRVPVRLVVGVSAAQECWDVRSQLVNLVDSRRPAAGELVADTLGLLAHFWFAGETAKEYARVRLERVVDSLEKDLVSALDAAADHCAQTTQFRTADLLRRLRRDVEAVASP